MHRLGRTGRPPLTERRKAATRLDIAREAVRLFTTRGVAATSADEIADAAGISVRTLWRYFPNKERCVWPLLAAGIESTAQALRSWSPSEGVGVLLDLMQRTIGKAVADTPAVLELIRLTRTEPSLRAVWLQAHDVAEPVFATALAHRSGLPEDSLRVTVQAAMINSALRAAVEHYAWQVAAIDETQAVDDGLMEAVRTALLTAAEGLPRSRPVLGGLHHVDERVARSPTEFRGPDSH